MNWLHYLLEANLYLAVFYTGYYLFLSRETHYTLNRVYLLFSSIVSFVLPVIQLGILKPVEQPITAVHLAYTMAATTFTPVHSAPVTPAFTLQDGIVYGYLLGGAVLLLVLMIKLYQLFKLTRLQHPGTGSSYKVIYLKQSDTAFSFFNYLFIGSKVEQPELIIKHELVHISQKHSVDIVFIELLKIVNWFNPFIYLLQNSLKAIHEYIADEKTASSGTDTLTYSSFLVNNAYGLSGSSIAHSFFNYNLLKKRIIMLHQKRSGSLARLKYLLAVPICGGLLCASTLAFSKTYGWVDIAPHSAIDTDKVRLALLPSPPAPPVKKVKFLEQTELKPVALGGKTSKGYHYTETDYLENGKQDITISIQEKDGSHKYFTKSTATKADIVLLKDKYGYVFPAHLRMPPPPPAPPIKRIKFPLPNPMTQHTAKGYYYSESGYMGDIFVTIKEKDGSHKEYDKNKATVAELAMLKDKYGYVFPAHLKMSPPPPPVIVPDKFKAPSAKLPPPPPAASAKVKRYPPPVIVADKQANGQNHKLPPPPPAPPVQKLPTVRLLPPQPAPVVQKLPTVRLLPPPSPPAAPAAYHFTPAPPTAHATPTYTKNGYRYEEDGYTVNGKTDFRVIIVEKNGNQLSYFKSKATPAEIKLLSEKYGYTFPVMEIYTKLPPPPPTAPVSGKKSAKTLIYTNDRADSFSAKVGTRPAIALDSLTYTLKGPVIKGQMPLAVEIH